MQQATEVLQAARLQVHGAAVRMGERLEFQTDSAQWSYAVSLRIDVPRISQDMQPLLTVELLVREGSVGIGVVDRELRQFVTSETDCIASPAPVNVEMRLDAAATPLHLMIRNSAPGGIASRFQLISAAVAVVPKDELLLTPKSPPGMSVDVYGYPSTSLTIEVFVSHTSRRWFSEQCDRSYLRHRYSSPDRLLNPPVFESLPPNEAPYYGLLTIMRLGLSAGGVESHVLRHYVSPEKVVHAAVIGSRIAVCFDAGLALTAREEDVSFAAPDPHDATRIIDPWFGGLHTVIPVDERTCLVSSSGADAILWLDVDSGRVVRRWRLPSERYGSNYSLDESTWLSEHYINNDLQLGHLNCASPDGRGGALFSTLAQGDIGRVDAQGRCGILATGYVGCHGVRYTPERDWIYFCDSCSGRLLHLDSGNTVRTLFETGSAWLHDAVHLRHGLFLLSLPDRNQLLLVDTDSGKAVAGWHFVNSGGTVQFLSVSPHPAL